MEHDQASERAGSGLIDNTPAAWTKRAELAPSSHEAALWSKQGQRERFEAILYALSPHRGESLLDYGCGTGALVEQLPPEIDYLGYDWSPGMVARASTEHPQFSFTNSFPLGMFDLIAFIGPFNLSDAWSATDTWNELWRMWSHCRRAMAVSLYCGHNPECIVYEASDCAEFIRYSRGVGAVSKIRENDLLLFVERK